MKLLRLSAITIAVLGSSMTMAATTTAQPYQYNSNAGVLANTTGAVSGTARTLFNTATNPGSISAEIGTLGYGANIAWSLNDSVELQAGWSGMDFDDNTELNSNDSWINYEKALGDGYEDFRGDFNYDVDFSNPYIGVQMRPMKNWLTVGAGVLVPDNKFSATLTSRDSTGNASPVTIDGREFRIADGTAVDLYMENKNQLAPYATIGFRPNVSERWGGFIEAGAAYMGDVKSNVNVRGGNVVEVNNNNVVINPNAINEFEQQAEEELGDNDDLWYPIVKAGITMRF